MKRFILTSFTVVCLLLMVSPVMGKEYRPVVSGNYEEGSRVYDQDEGVGDYDFKSGWLKYKKKLTSKSYYYLKGSYHRNDFLERDNYDSESLKLLGNFTYQLTDPFRLKTEVGIKQKDYPIAVHKSYQTLSSNLEFQYKVKKLDKLKWRLSLKENSYPENDKDNMLAGVTLRWEKDLNDKFEIHSQYKISRQNYYYSQSLSDKSRYSISIGFEYQI